MALTGYSAKCDLICEGQLWNTLPEEHFHNNHTKTYFMFSKLCKTVLKRSE